MDQAYWIKGELGQIRIWTECYTRVTTELGPAIRATVEDQVAYSDIRWIQAQIW